MKTNKTFIDELIKWMLLKLNQWKQSRIKKYGSSMDNPNNFEVLLPNDESDKKRYYVDSLLIPLNTPNANNIAITGPYGSGKSSFIESFKAKYSEWEYLTISLATFQTKKNEEEGEFKQEKEEKNVDSEKNENTENKNKYEIHQEIERSILQQFFYREKDSTVAQSRFKKIKKINKFDVFFNTIMISFLGFWSFFLFNHFRKESLDIFPSYLNTYLHEITVVYVVIGLAFLYRIFYYFSNLQVAKFNFKKGEVTLAKQDKASILNEHLDEILYFFSVTKYNVVFFEDIDRFNDTEIFIKLRELNNLINNSKEINRRVIFVYAIRDDMFIDKERTKFFDYIVPIIPYINPSNSEQKMIEKFKVEIDDKKLDENFISQVSLYIDDMRLLLNIYNEYMVYKNNLESSNLNYNQLLALVICKNFYPLDFSKLHTREGIIYNLFTNKPMYIKDKIKNYNKQKNELKTSIKNIEEENIQSLDELKMIYLGKLFSEIKSDAITIKTLKNKSLSELFETDILDTLDSETICQGLNKYCYNYSQMGFQNNKKITFGEIEKLINPHFTYRERKEQIENKFNNKVDELKKEIEEIDKKINDLKEASLKELFEISPDLIIKGYEDKDLLIFLVRNGYIDENYEHYISYFHKGGITQEDREFLLSVQNHKALEFNFKLGNINKLIQKLTIRDFKQKEILNFDLTNFMLENNKYKEKTNEYFKKISDGGELSIKFIFAYLDNASKFYQKRLIQILEWKGLWEYIYKEFSEDKQNEYFNLIFDSLDSEIFASEDIEKLVNLNINDSLKEYLEKQTILPKYIGTKNSKYKTLIKELKLHFSNIENPLDNEELFNCIYENWNYELNEKMIEIMLVQKGNIDITDLDKAHLTTIRKSEAKELIEYIEECLPEYVENVFLGIETNTKESEETVLYLLNSENIDNEDKIKIIQKEEVRISDINTVSDKELWIELFKYNKIEAIWDNILYYYQETEELSDEVIDYLNIEENYIELSKSKIDSEEKFEENFRKDFNRQIILSDALSNEAYNELIKATNYWYESLNFEHLEESKIDILLKNKKIQLTKEIFLKLKENFSPRHITLIENFKDEFLEEYEVFEIDEDDLVLLLKSDKFGIEEKFSFIEKLELPNIQNNVSAKETISKFYIDNVKYIENINLFDKLFYGENKYDLELLILQIPYLDNCESIKTYLNEFGKPYDELLEGSSKKLYVEDINRNKSLLQKLQEKGYITSFKEHTSISGKKKLKIEKRRGCN